MISFRFHLVSISAVFLALALGIVLGATVVNQASVDVLNGRIKQVRSEAADARDDLSLWERFGNDSQNAVISGQLEGVRVFVVVPEGVDGGLLNDTRTILAAAGAIDAGTLTLDSSWSDDSDRTRNDVMTGLGIVGPIGTEALFTQAATRLATELAAGGGPTLPILAGLNLVKLDAGDPATAPGAEARVVVIDDGAPAGFLGPLVRQLGVAMPARVLVADDSATETFKDSLVWQLRDDPEDTKLSTVDHLNSVPGRVALVLALREFERGFVGDYGSAPGADRAVPTGG